MKFIALHDNSTGNLLLVSVAHLQMVYVDMVYLDDEEGVTCVECSCGSFHVKESVADICRLLSIGGDFNEK